MLNDEQTESMPLVSIIVPTKDRPQFLAEAVRSILTQTYKNIEIIVVNDGGEDISHVISDSNGGARIVHLRIDRSMGPSASRNAGLKNASGKYIAYLDDDDIYYPTHIETLTRFLEKGSHSVAYADSYQAFQRAEGRGYVTFEKKPVYSEAFDRQRLLVMNYIRTENLIHRRECITEVGLFDEELKTHEDWDFWIRLSCKYEFRHIKKVTAEFRTRVNSSGITAINRPDFLRTMRIIHRRYAHLAKDGSILQKQKYMEEELEKEIAMREKLSLKPDSLCTVESKSGVTTLKVKTGDGNWKTLHSLYDPESEAKTLVDAFEFDGKGVLVVLGMGLGYHIAELLKKFPEAEMLVVEAYSEICELAREKGPELKDGLEFISGISHEDALKKITSLRMKNGISPVSVFSLSSAVAAFPSFYQPILASLKNTMAVKLWDKLRYAKFKDDRQKILLIDSGYFLIREVERALRASGHTLTKIEIRKDNGGRDLIPKFVEMILKAKPDFVLTINHLGFDEDGVLASFLRSIEMPAASWYVDSPNLIVRAFEKNISPFVSLFLWDRCYSGDMKALGFESVEYLPLGTDETVFTPMNIGSKKIQRNLCDVRFVGNSMVKPVQEWTGKVGEKARPLIDKMADILVRTEGVLAPAYQELEKEEQAVINGMDQKERMQFEAALFWKATLLYRLSCLKMLKGFDVKIHGDSGWRSLIDTEEFGLLPQLNYYRELPLYYNTSRINFNATSLQMRQTVNQRVFDVPACGAFILTDHQKDLEELFEVGEEIVVYRDKAEIPDLVRFYLDNPEKRETVAKKGRARVLRDHTYRHRLDRMIRHMKGRFKQC